jgi:two-component system invasion response regulator UvrY
MPGIGGLEAIKKILHNNPTVKIIALTACVEEPYPSKLLQAGVMGYLTKDASLEEMVLAIKTVHAGKNYISLDVAQKLALKSVKGEGSLIDQLSERELQVMMMIINGQKPQAISDILCLSSKTVNSYRYRVFDKLGVANDVELTHFAIRHGILEMACN